MPSSETRASCLFALWPKKKLITFGRRCSLRTRGACPRRPHTRESCATGPRSGAVDRGDLTGFQIAPLFNQISARARSLRGGPVAASAHPGGANRSPEGACDCLSLPRSANGQTGENHFLIVLIILREFKIFISRAPTRPEFALGERGSCCTAHFFQTLPPGRGAGSRGPSGGCVLKTRKVPSGYT